MNKILLFILAGCISLLQAQVPVMSSRPEATSVVLLDFDGHTVTNTSWNIDYEVIDAAPANLNPVDVTTIFNIVKEDFIAFNINITTDSNYYNQASVYSRHRIIITPTHDWYTGPGTGVANIGGFPMGDETPSWVFTALLHNNFYRIAEVISHELGHALGFRHISVWNEDCSMEDEYKKRQGSVFPTFAPIMGESFDADISGWVHDLNQLACDEWQDEPAMLSSGQFGFLQVPDDISDHFSTAKEFPELMAHVTNGIISDSNDIDIFKVVLTQPRQMDIDVTPTRARQHAYMGVNLHLRVDLYDGDSNLVRTYYDPNKVDVFIDTLLHPGTYYFAVQSAGNAYMDRYSSIGSYEFLYLIGHYTLPVYHFALQGRSDQGDHLLEWNYQLSKEETMRVVLYHSIDGINFQVLETALNAGNLYRWRPPGANTPHFYKIGLYSELSDVEYFSNIVRINNTIPGYRLHGNQVNNSFELTMRDPGVYQITDMTGRIVQQGRLATGLHKIPLQYMAKGLLLLRIIQGSESYVEKLIVR